MPCIETKLLIPALTDEDIRLYLYKVLEALDYAHSHGIMHRDVKPLNIVINPESKQLRLIDWGLADYYKPGQEYNVRVASRYYKGPELLVDDKLYHYSLDIWSTGCTMAGMIFRRDTFFKGLDNFDQLLKIIKVLGKEDLDKYLKRYNLRMPIEVKKMMGSKEWPKQPWENFITAENMEFANEDALDLLDKMLQFDKNLRIRPKDAMQHKYFHPIRAEIVKQREQGID